MWSKEQDEQKMSIEGKGEKKETKRSRGLTKRSYYESVTALISLWFIHDETCRILSKQRINEGAGCPFKNRRKKSDGVGKLYDEQRWSCKMLGEEERPTTIPGLFEVLVFLPFRIQS